MRKKININEVIPNDNNPRIIKDYRFLELVQSIKDFPEMLEKRPLIVDENMMILGGNMRLKALHQAGINEIWIDVAEGWSDEKKKEFIIKDNINYGQWDWDVLANEWEIDELNNWGLDKPMFDNIEYNPNVDPKIDTSDITEKQIEKKAEELAKKMVKEFRNSDVICPSCGHEFKVKL
tara:strand:- start:576 stop:1109 length:534 start_codon:yes stop_codon:yes gene_type:complete